MGTLEKARICIHASSPSSLGIIRSKMTRSGFSELVSATALSPSKAVTTSYPSCSRLNLMPLTTNFSSSTTKIFIISLQSQIGQQPLQRRLTDALHLQQLLVGAEPAVGVSVGQDGLGFLLPDAGQVFQFCLGRLI